MDDRISELEIQLKAAQNELAETYKRISELESQDALLRRKKQDAQIRLMVSRTPVNKPRGRVPDLDFQEWQKAIEAVWKRKDRLLIQESEELRRDLFKTKISLLIKDNPDFSDIPFAYCDVNRQILCTPAIYDIFEIKKEEPLTMRDLLDCVGGEERKGVFEAFKKGIRLKNYRLREGLTLNSYPLFYGELPVGVGVFLIESKRNLSRERNYSFARKVLTEVKKISEDYRFLRASLELVR